MAVRRLLAIRLRQTRGGPAVGTGRRPLPGPRATAPFRRARRRREQLVAPSPAASRTAVRHVPRRLQPEQPAVPVRRARRARGRAAVRLRHAAVRVAGVGPVVLPVHEHVAGDARPPVGRLAGRVLRRPGRGRGPGRPRARPRRTRRRDGRVRAVRTGARCVFRALPVRESRGRRGTGKIVLAGQGQRNRNRIRGRHGSTFRRHGICGRLTPSVVVRYDPIGWSNSL